MVFLGKVFGVFWHDLIPFLFCRFGLGQVKEVGDGCFHASKVRWVGAVVDGSLQLV